MYSPILLPDSSVGKESPCNAGDSGSIPGLGKSAGEGIGYPSQYSWASLVAQMVKNPPTVRETWLRSLGWKAPLEKGVATHSSILGQRSLVGCSPWGCKESDMTERLSVKFSVMKSKYQGKMTVECTIMLVLSNLISRFKKLHSSHQAHIYY